MNIDPILNRLIFSRLQNLDSDLKIKYSNLLSSIYTESNNIWNNLDLDKFPDHTVNSHSINIVKKFIEFNEIFHWNENEIILFSISSFIHDIGMQYRKWISTDLLKKFPHLFIDPKFISDEEIRKRHCELGMNLIKVQTENYDEIGYPARFCANDDVSNNFLYHGALIAFSHSSNSNILLEQLSPKFYNTTYFQGQDCRFRLLVCMMILCDELDGTYLRIENPERINLASMDETSRIYWLSNIFVEDVCINIVSNPSQNKKSSECEIKWRVPLGSSEEEIEKIRSFVNFTRLGKLNNEITRIQCYLNSNNDHDSLRSPIYGKMAINYSKNVITVHKKYWDLINTTLIGGVITTNGDKKDKAKESIIKSDLIKRIDFASNKNGFRLKNDVISWYHKNNKPGHFVLKSGEHTNVYLNCRSLVSDYELNLNISNFIWQLYKNKKITNVFGVGTSSIPLAVNTAFRLSANVTFTMAKETVGPIDEALDTEYIPMEVIPKTTFGDILLIIDDVISGGNVAKKVIDSIKVNEFPKEIFHFSIFRLGNREINRHEKIGDNYSWLEHIPYVNYYTNEGECPMCDENIPKVYEWM